MAILPQALKRGGHETPPLSKTEILLALVSQSVERAMQWARISRNLVFHVKGLSILSAVALEGLFQTNVGGWASWRIFFHSLVHPPRL